MRYLDMIVSFFAVLMVITSSVAVSQGTQPQGTYPSAMGPEQPAPNTLSPPSAVVLPQKDHPLTPVLNWVHAGRPAVVKLKDYTALVSKQESIKGEIQEAQMMELKVRHEPFSVYLKFVYPKAQVGKEAIFVKGQNNDKLIGHGVGLEKMAGTQFLDPEGFIAMRGNKYPITDIGILNLVDKLAEVGEKDMQYGECTVTYTENVPVDKRPCTIIRVEHPQRRSYFRFHVAIICVDNELNMPIRYESYDWPKQPDGPTALLERYAYQKIAMNVGLTDEDFNYKNPAYDFK